MIETARISIQKFVGNVFGGEPEKMFNCQLNKLIPLVYIFFEAN